MAEATVAGRDSYQRGNVAKPLPASRTHAGYAQFELKGAVRLISGVVESVVLEEAWAQYASNFERLLGSALGP
ncbi:MAG: hypothetical protein F4X77_19080 [Acidobacteriia bacterium]|nr:hypothetical protein [Terriglobia bacterium]